MSNQLETKKIEWLDMEFVLIPAGSFAMGAGASDPHANPCERPQHNVTISRPFYLGKHPVTLSQWEKVMGEMRRTCTDSDCPVVNVSYLEAQEFIRRLNEEEGHNRCRLPTEAEWEYACRAGTTGRYYFGDDEALLKDYAWYDENSGGQPQPVGKKKPNDWGLHDMHGNVWEWVEDWFAPYESGSAKDPHGPAEGLTRVRRGGSWADSARNCRAAARQDNAPRSRLQNRGFRVAMTAK